DVVAQRPESPPESPRSVVSHLNERGGAVSVIVARHSLEVSVELEVFHRVLVVTLHEADGRDALTDQPKNPEGYLVFVRAHYLDSPTVGLEHRRVVDAQSVGVGDGGLLVGIDGTDTETRVASTEHFYHVSGSPSRLILPLVEIGELDILVQPVDDGLGLLRRGEDGFASEIEVYVVEVESDIGEDGQAERRDDDGACIEEAREAPEARHERQPRAQGEQDDHRDQPACEPYRVDHVEAVHGKAIAARAFGRSGRDRPGRWGGRSRRRTGRGLPWRKAGSAR